jgi:AraC-like DNA-binding protein
MRSKTWQRKTANPPKLLRKKSVSARENGQVHFRGRLQLIHDWEGLAVQACYSGTVLSRLCGISIRHLQRHIRSRFGATMGTWLNNLRLRHAYERLAAGYTVKETAFSLGFKQVSHFSRCFKRCYGICPSSVAITIGLSRAKPEVSTATKAIQLPLF